MARPRSEPQNRTTTAVRFPQDIHETLRETADEVGVSINWLINRAVVEYLNRLELPLKLTRPQAPTSETSS